ncbi:MAG: sugar phosphate isomerase/epimerase [Clostridia bacterium]|nr:sugar phosphate isomerase/epimerase [Clostridia bacterium]
MKITAYNRFMADLSRGGAQYAAEHCASLGFDSVELLDRCGTAPSTLKEKYTAEEICEALEKHGLQVACFSSYANLLCEDKAFFECEIRRQIDYAAAIGSPNFHHTIIPGLKISEKMPTYEEVFEEIAERTESIAHYCAERGINCLYEPQGLYFNGREGLGRLIRRLRESCPNVGLCADVGNSLFVDDDPVELFRELAPYAMHVHVKDYRISNAPLELPNPLRSKGGTWLYDVEIGKGDIHIAECLTQLKNAGYNGYISLEVSGDDQEMKDAIEYVRSIYR